MGRPPTSNFGWTVPHLKLWRDRPPVPPRSPPMRLQIAALHSHVEERRSIGSQMKLCMDNVREDLKQKHIDLTRSGETTRNRVVWKRSHVRASSSAR